MTMLLINVFGGLAIFIFGMNAMSDGLHKAAGERMRSILRFFSANRFVAILSGTVVTAIVQSSSASTVMVIGFVNAGLLTLVQSIGIIFGANIGTTVTAQLVAFNIEWIIMPAIILGFLMSFIKNKQFSAWSLTILGFGFLFLGMELMSDQLKALSSEPSFIKLFSLFDCAPVNGWIPPFTLLGAISIGMLATLIIQSSSACSGIVIALGASGIINLYTAVALVLGSNIGTTITAQIAAITANRIAKQAALAHTLFNVIGILLIISTFWFRIGPENTPIFFSAINALSSANDLPRQIANAHTIFNVCTTLLLVPFIPLLARLCERIIPLPPQRIRYMRLEPHLLNTPVLALTQTTSTLRHMLVKAWKMVECALNTYDRNTDSNREMVKQLPRREARIDELQKEITAYLTALMQHDLSPRYAAMVPQLLHCTNDVERIGDHTSIILHLIATFETNSASLSDLAKKELSSLRAMLSQQAASTISLLANPSPAEQATAQRLKTDIIKMIEAGEANHITRLTNGQCTPLVGLFYVELLAEIRKLSRHLANITDRIPQIRV